MNSALSEIWHLRAASGAILSMLAVYPGKRELGCSWGAGEHTSLEVKGGVWLYRAP